MLRSLLYFDEYDSRPVILLTLHVRAFRCAILRDKKRQEKIDISNKNGTISLHPFYVKTIVLYLNNSSRSKGVLGLRKREQYRPEFC